MNEEASRLMELYIRRVLREVRANRETQSKIRAELQDHIMCFVEDCGGSQEQAVKDAIVSLGSPVEVGKRYNESYKVYMSLVDWAALIIPWLLGPIFTLILFSGGGLPEGGLWYRFLLTGVLALLIGTYNGKRFSKASLCVFTGAFPALYLFGWFFIPTFGSFSVAALLVGLWVIVYIMSCLWNYSEIAFTKKLCRGIQKWSAISACALLCCALGFSISQMRLINITHQSACSTLGIELAKIADSQSQSYEASMPYDSIRALDYAYFEAFGESSMFEGFLQSLALFVVDYDEFRGGARREEYLSSENMSLSRQRRVNYIFTMDTLDCSTLADLDQSARDNMAKEALVSLSTLFSDYAAKSADGLTPTMSIGRLRKLYEDFNYIEDQFFIKLSDYAIDKNVPPPKMPFMAAGAVDEYSKEAFLDMVKENVGVIVTDGQDISPKSLTMLLELTGYEPGESFYMDAVDSDIIRYFIVWYDGESCDMEMLETDKWQDNQNKGEVYDMVRAEAERIYESLTALGEQ